MAIQIQNAVFLHIPKTGGTWVTHYFMASGMPVEEVGLAHVNGVGFGETSDLIFCFVRHPLTWFRSYWECKQHIPDRRGGFLDTIVDLPFSDFIDAMLEQVPGYLTDFYSGYTDRARFIGKQESLRKDLNAVLSYLRIPYNKSLLFGMPDENVVPSVQKFTIGQALEIMKHEHQIIERFDYDYLPGGVLK